MCFSTPKMPDVQSAPRRSNVDTTSQRQRLGEAQGMYGNIFTSALGDSSYGRSARSQSAVLGGRAA